jgi:F-type H+-transporting ATPase subunit gamma
LATTREIKRRIRSVKNIAQVTKAMEAVSASKMRRAQAQAQATRPYANKAMDVLSFLARIRSSYAAEQPLLQQREVRSVALLLITADRGLAGGLNSHMISAAARWIKTWQDEGKQVELVTVGKKGRDWMRKYGPPIRAEFVGIGDRPASGYLAASHRRRATAQVGPIARVLIDDFVAERYDAVYVGYMKFINTVKQEPEVDQLLPIVPDETVPADMAIDYIFEPDAETVLGQILQSFLEIEILQALYEAIASEHSARMVAMRNATEAADELIGDLTLTYNKARQHAITMSLLDIAGAVAALEK